MTTALIDYLISFKDTQITIASNMLEEAQKLTKKDVNFLVATNLNVFNVRLSLLTNKSSI